MKPYGYGSYRGRSRLRTVLKTIIVLLAVILVLAVAALLFLQRYMVFSADGVRFELPFLQQDGGDPAEEDPAVLVTEPPVVVTPSPTPAPEYLRAVELPRSALYDGTAEDQVSSAGGNAALFDMKGDDGRLGYVSSLKLALDIHASASDSALNNAIEELNGGELYTIARVSCFRDNILPYYRNDLALRTNSGNNWKDDERVRWASPADETVREYLAGVCVELAELGFDEILLDNAGYPTRGSTANMRVGADYDPGNLGEAVEAAYAAISEALKPYGVKLSIAATADTVTEGEDPASGQSLRMLVRYAGRVWLSGTPEEAESWRDALGTAGLRDPEVNCVVSGASAGGSSGSWALLMEE